MERKKRILVAGGAGFLGSHLCERLLQIGHEVLCIDNFLTGSKENIEGLFQRELFEYIEHDVCTPLDLEVDEIYNFACPASPIHYQEDPIYTMKTSVFGAFHLLGLAKRFQCKIFQASTSEVYGDPQIHPQQEAYWGNVNPVGVRSCYDEGKRCAETLFFDYHRMHGVPIRVGRIFNTYGPKMHPQDGRVVSNFIVQALQNLPITIYGSGEQTRSFCYVDDLIDIILLFMDSSFTGPLNIGNPGEFSILKLAESILTLTGSSSKIIYKELPKDDPKQRRPDITQAKCRLGWAPKISLEEGLKKTIQYFEEKLSYGASFH